MTGVAEVTIRNAYKDMYTQGPRGGRAELVQGLKDAKEKGDIVFKIAEGKGVHNLPNPEGRQNG